MPCYDDRSNYCDHTETNERITELTRILCETVDYMRKNKIALPAPIRTWALEHDRVDAERLRKEKEKEKNGRLREKAINKLSPRERALLGLK